MPPFIRKNAVEIDLRNHFKIHKVIKVSHTVLDYEQPSEIRQPVKSRSEPVPMIEGEEEFFDRILNK